MPNKLQVSSPLVSVDWLQANMNATNLLILDATIPKVGTKTSDASLKECIPNAVFFDIKNEFSDANAKYPNTILHPEEFEFKAQNLGINKDTCIVVYDDLGVYSAPRVWWMFTTFGFTNVAVLNGGLPAWKRANLYTEKEHLSPTKKGDFIANYIPQKIRFTEDVLASLSSSTCIADARSSNRFFGLEPEPRKEVKSGHIPSSINIPFTLLLSGGKMKPKEELELIFAKFNSQKNPMIFSCGSGITACILALGAELAGYKDYAVYDGSWSEWGSREELSVELNNNSENWTKQDFTAYVLLYMAQSNYIETETEREYILSRVDETSFNKVHTEIVHDNDYQSVEKIKRFLLENKYSQEDKSLLIKEIKEVCFADGTIDALEKNAFLFLKNILK